jgi:predicted lipoprotein with Yx(FWY)xxD motif
MNRSPNVRFAARDRLRIVAVTAALGAVAAVALLLAPPTQGAKSTAAVVSTAKAPVVSTAKAPVVSTAKTSLGRILVDARGRTLYLFEKDRNGKSACNGQCATVWPPLIAGAKPRVAGGAKAALVGTTKRADGRRQVTYNGHPLYTFVMDKKPGQTKGQGLDAFGAKWYVISPAGRKIVLTGLAPVDSAGPAAKTVRGSVGPGFAISVKLGAKKATKLRPGTYRFTVTDKSSIHNFRLSGPGYNKAITTVAFKGTKTVTVKLRNGTYRYQCDPHANSMNGTFKVG